MTIDETSYDPGTGAMGDDHPIVWPTTLMAVAPSTPLSATYQDNRFKEQIRGALRWAAGARIFGDGFETGTTERWSAGR